MHHGLPHTPESKVTAVWICRELLCLISSVSIYYAPESDIQVKSYDHLKFLRSYVVQFWAHWYIMGLNRTPISKVMDVLIGPELSYSILIVSIYTAPESDIRVKSFDLLNFSGASVVHFRVSQYIMGVNHTTESKVMAIWICRDHSCSIMSISIYYASESDIRVNLWPFDFLESFRRSFWSVSIYHGCQSYSHVISNRRLNCTGAFMFNFDCLDVLCAWIGHPCERLWAFEFHWSFRCSFSSVSTYDGHQSYTQLKSYGRLNMQRSFVFNFKRLDILCAWIGHPSEKLWPFEFLESFRCSFWSVSIYHGPESYTRLKSYGRWNLPRAFVFSFDCLEILNAESNIRVKSYDFLNFSCASVIHFRVFRYIMGVNHTIESKVMAVWIFREHSCLILRISIYYELELDIWVKSSMTFWISR